MFRAQNSYNRDKDSLGAAAAEPVASDKPDVNAATGDDRRRDEHDAGRPLSIRSLLNVSNTSNGRYTASPLSPDSRNTHTFTQSLSPPDHRDYHLHKPDTAISPYALPSLSSNGVGPNNRSHAVGAGSHHHLPLANHHSPPVSAPSMFSYPHHPHHHAHPHLVSARGMYHASTPVPTTDMRYRPYPEIHTVGALPATAAPQPKPKPQPQQQLGNNPQNQQQKQQLHHQQQKPQPPLSAGPPVMAQHASDDSLAR
ncbi:hypothetical protein GGI05_005508, partial [Coemansia sp. RSA 2603]